MLRNPLATRSPGRAIIIVPGNHDVDRARINKITESGLRHTLCSREAAASTLASTEDMTAALARLTPYHAFEAAWYSESGTSFECHGVLGRVFHLDVGSTTMGIAALNSAWRAGGEADKGHLLIGEPQLRESLAAIADFPLRLVITHHPLDWLAAFDATTSRALLEQGEVFVLTGHDHSPDPTQEVSTRGAALYSRAGCLYAGHNYTNAFTLLDLDPTAHRATVTIRRWWPSRGEFAEATDMPSGGRVALPWPRRSEVLRAQSLWYPQVLMPLAQIAREHSVLPEPLGQEGDATLSDLLVPPRFSTVPPGVVLDH